MVLYMLVVSQASLAEYRKDAPIEGKIHASSTNGCSTHAVSLNCQDIFDSETFREDGRLKAAWMEEHCSRIVEKYSAG